MQREASAREKTVRSDPGVTTDYLLDANLPLPQVLEERQNGSLLARYEYGPSLLRQTTGSGTKSWYLTDGLDSVRAVTNDLGNVTQSFGYDAYGNPTPATAGYRFNGQRYDGSLYDLRARCYDPGRGVFLSQDPLLGSPTDPVTLHRYLYAADDPVDRVDPSGQYTSAFGRAVEAAIRPLYEADHPTEYIKGQLSFGSWWRIGPLFMLKPDIQNRGTHKYMEIKPLSPIGIRKAASQMAVYAGNAASHAAATGVRWTPDTSWVPKDPLTDSSVILVGDVPTLVFNLDGVLFYTDSTEVEREAAAVAGIAAAWKIYNLSKNLPGVISSLQRAGRLVQVGIAGSRADVESDVGIATLNGMMGNVGFAL